MRSPWNTAAIAVPDLDFTTPPRVEQTVPDGHVVVRLFGTVTLLGNAEDLAAGLRAAADAIEAAP